MLIIVNMTDFPHLEGVTPFPYNDTPPAPYTAYRNTFDYTLWTAGTSLKLCAVPWDAENVVEWADDATRDKWFNALDGYETTLQTPLRMTGRTVKVPLPYDMSALYNYCWVTLSPAPVDSENETRAILNWGFYIDSLDYRSPSATELTLTPDWWTTCRHRVTIKSLRLQQGHWAVANSATPADYLADPLAHTANLLDQEGDTLANARQVRNKITQTWNTGEQLAVIDFGLTNPYGDYTGGMPSISQGAPSVGGAPAGYMLAIDTAHLDTFLTQAPAGLVLSARALWIIPARFLSLSQAATLYGATTYRVLSTRAANTDITLTLPDFGYPESAAKWTKLYTGQYARLTLTRDDGTAVSIPIEQTGQRAALKARAEITDSGARILSYLAGIGDEDQTTYSVVSLNATDAVTGGTWQQTLHQWDIPAYAIQLTNAKATAWSKHYERANSNAQAYAAYQNALASADTGKANADRSADTGKSNADASADTGKSNADASADTAKANTTRSTNLSVANTTRSVNTSTTNQTLSNELTEDQTNLAVAVANENNWENIENQINRLGVLGVTRTNSGALGSWQGDRPEGSQLDNLIKNAQLDYTYTAAQYSATREAGADGLAATALTNAVSGAAGIATQTAGGSTLAMGMADVATSPGVGSSLGGDPVVGASGAASVMGALGTIAGFGVSMIGTALNFGVSVQKEQAVQDASRAYQIGDGAIGAGGKVGLGVQNLLYQNQQERILARGMQTNQNQQTRALLNGGTLYDVTVRHGQLSTATSINQNNGALANQNAAASKTTADSNASATQSTTKANATRSRDTSKANATRSRDTAKTNAEATQTTAKANAKRTYDAALATTQAGIDTDARQPALMVTTPGGASMWTVKPAGDELKVERPLDGDVLRIADRFNRLGYRCDRLINAPSLLQMPEWTYWQCASVVARPGELGAPRQAVESIRQRLLTGVTVWRAPAMIGDVEQ